MARYLVNTWTFKKKL